MHQGTKFISVEIVVKTDHECGAFVKWFESQDNHVEQISCDTHRWHVYFAPLPCATAEITIQTLQKVILDLPPDVRKQWNDAGIREFFVGYGAGYDPNTYVDYFSPDTLAMVAEIGAGIRIAIYPPSMHDAGLGYGK